MYHPDDLHNGHHDDQDHQTTDTNLSVNPHLRRANAPSPYYFQSECPDRSRLSTIFSEPEHDELHDEVGELSESTYLKMTSTVEQLPDFRRASFSSINCIDTREDFATALDNLCDSLKQPFRYDRSSTPKVEEPPVVVRRNHIVLTDPSLFKKTSKMDSPNEHSPNASPRHELPHLTDVMNVHTTPAPIASSLQRDSNPGSLDSTGFEKVEPPSQDVLEAYSRQFADQMQQSIFGQLPEDPMEDQFAVDNGFEVLNMTAHGNQVTNEQTTNSIQPASSNIGREEEPEPLVHLLHRIPGDIDDPKNPAMSSRPNDDVLEKSYGDLVDIPKNVADEVGHKADEIKDAAHDLIGEILDKAPEKREQINDDFADLLGPTEHAPPPPTHSSHLDDFDPIPRHPVETNQENFNASDIIHEAKDAIYNKNDGDEDIREQVEDMHDDVDAIMNRMKENDDWVNEEHPTSPSADSGRDVVGKLIGDDEDDVPNFGRQTPEEQTFDRQGPLTIPELPETVPQEPSEDEFGFHRPADHHHGFETEPRPPTPPKDLSDEDMKPSVVNLGPAPHHHHGTQKQHSILKHSGGGPWIDFKTMDPRLLDLIYWRDPKKSGIALSLTLVALFVLATYPILSVVAYTSLLVLAGTLGFRIFKAVEAQIKKTDQQNPFQPLLEQDITLPQEKVHEQVDVLVEHGQLLANQTRRLFLVESILDSVKFGLLLWSLTYISAWFSGFGLLILAVLGVFSIPKFYEVYQEPIDQHLGVIKGHIDNVCNVLEEKLPFLRRAHAAAEPEKKDQ